MKNAIPDAILKKHTAIFGMTGSGKSSTSKLLVEQVVADNCRVCILDPTKSDHWGLTSSKSGKGPGLPFQILGGPHGHVPLHAGAWAPIAELVASGNNLGLRDGYRICKTCHRLRAKAHYDAKKAARL